MTEDAPSLTEALAEAELRLRVRGPGCWFGLLSPEDKATLNRYFATGMTTSAIGDALRSSGTVISDFRVGWHRRGKCACPR